MSEIEDVKAPAAETRSLSSNPSESSQPKGKHHDDHVQRWAARLCGKDATVADVTEVSRHNQKRWEEASARGDAELALRQAKYCPHRKALLRCLKFHFAACDALLEELKNVAAPVDDARTRQLLSRPCPAPAPPHRPRSASAARSRHPPRRRRREPCPPYAAQRGADPLRARGWGARGAGAVGGGGGGRQAGPGERGARGGGRADRGGGLRGWRGPVRLRAAAAEAPVSHGGRRSRGGQGWEDG
jgi:hypothetical protein